MYGSAGAEAMLQSADEVLSISIEQGFALWLAFGNVMRGWSLAVLGQADEGVNLLLNGLAGCGETGCGIVVPFWLAVAGEAYGRTGQSEQALKQLAQAEDMIERTNEDWPKAEVHRLRGTLLLEMQDTRAAEASLYRALEVARQQRAKFWELRAALALARLWRDQDRRHEARELLAPVYSLFSEGFDVPDVRDAQKLLGELAPH
jgi:predicted ATPase